MSIFEKIGVPIDYVVIGLAGGMVMLFLLVVVLFIKNAKLKKRYTAFMQGDKPESFEEVMKARFQDIDTIKEILVRHQAHFDELDEVFKASFQKMGIVRYDAFKEMGGTLSFALAVLNKEDSGFIINSMYSTREGCYLYAKEVIHGESFVVLSEEEQEALEKAKKSQDLIQ